MNKTTVNTTEQKTKKTAKQIADEKAVIRFKNEQLKLYKVKTQKELTAEQKKEFNAKLLVFKANLQKTAEQSKTEQKQSKAKQTDKKQNNKAEQKTDKAEQKQKTAEQKQKALDAITKQLKAYEAVKNADGHYIVKANGYLIKFQVSAKDVKIRCNKKFAEATELETELHEKWNVKYAVNAEADTVIKAFLQLQKTAEAEQKKQQKEDK